MPVITLAIHPISAQKKSLLIKQLTEVAVEITQVPADKFVVFIDEFDNDAIGLAGRTRAQIVAEAAN